MKVYISGIAGTGMGSLALMAKAAGFEVYGSDLSKGAIYDELMEAGVDIAIGSQDGVFLQEKLKNGIDWFVYTSALPKEHAELAIAREAGLKCTKRDDFTAFLVETLGLKMVAVAGTHGKTTTTSMIVWASLKLNLPVAYVVGTTLGFAPSGSYHKGDIFFVYEADEYDRNFLKYHPWLAVIPAVSYDHPDIYPTKEDYVMAFEQFKTQSENVLEGDTKGLKRNDERIEMRFKPEVFTLAGRVRREDAALAAEAIKLMDEELQDDDIIEVLNEFPGVGRRFERLRDGLYSDYAHHPEEIAATIEVARDECRLRNKKGIVVIYQPHQNVRQYEVQDGYRDAFVGVDRVIWLPTYLTREDPELEVIKPEEFIADLSNKEIAEKAELDDMLADRIRSYLKDDYLVVLMTAGPADEWLRRHFSKT